MSYGFYRSISIDHTKVGSSDHTNFPVLISGTLSYLATVANGGKVQNANGYDVAFFSDSALTTQLKHETVKYTAASGVVAYFVKVPTVSHTADTVIYIAYGNGAISTDQSDKNNTWNSAFQFVHHFEDGTTLSLADSTANARTATGWTAPGSSGTPAAGAGKVAGGAAFDGSSFTTTAYDGSALTALTAVMWVNPTTNAASKGFMEWQASSLGNGGSGTPFVLFQNNNGTLQIYVDGSYRETSTSLSTGTAYRVGVTLTGSTTWKFYRNGVELSTYSGGVANQANALRVNFGFGFASQHACVIDEASISNVARSADWMLADYNNQNSPSTFSTIGTETANSVSYTLTAAQGSFTLTGEAVLLHVARTMAAAKGSFTFTGEAATLTRGKTLSASVGSFTLTGESVAFHTHLSMPAAHGSFVLTGESAIFTLFAIPHHFRARNAAMPKYTLIDTGTSLYTASLSLAPEYILTDIPQDV